PPGAPANQPVQPPATKVELDPEHRPECQRVLAEGGDGHVLDPSGLDPRHRVLAETGLLAHLRLAPTEAVTQRTKSAAELHVVHRASIAGDAYLPRISHTIPLTASASGRHRRQRRRVPWTRSARPTTKRGGMPASRSG